MIKIILKKIEELENKIDKLFVQTLSLSKNQFSKMLFDWFNEWLELYKKPVLKKNSYIQLEICVKHLKSVFKNVCLEDLTAFEIDKSINKIESSREKKYCYDTLGACLKKAYNLNLVTENVFLKTEKIVHKRKTGIALTLDEQKKFLFAIKNSKFENLYKFYLLSGCRLSEALYLKWKDIDFYKNLIFINGTKTEKSKRFIPLFFELKKLFCNIEKKSINVFPFTLDSVKGNFKRLKLKFDFNFRIHDLRHTFATRCLENGISLNVVQKWLGHAQASTTSNIYMHVQQKFELEQIKKFNITID